MTAMTPRAGARMVQHGWEVYSSDGERLGRVISVSATTMAVERGDVTRAPLLVDTRYIAEEEEGDRRATLGIDARTAESFSTSADR